MTDRQSLDRPTGTDRDRHGTHIVPVRIRPTEVDRGRQRIDSCQPTGARQGPDRGPTEGPTELDRARQTDSQGSTRQQPFANRRNTISPLTDGFRGKKSRLAFQGQFLLVLKKSGGEPNVWGSPVGLGTLIDQHIGRLFTSESMHTHSRS